MAICLFPLFARLGAAPIYMWDEATYANNSIDMYLTHDPVVVRMEGQPDLYNTKPPFVLWMQTLCLYIFGMNEFAIRFPSAFFALLTVLLLLWFSVAVLKSYVTGIGAVLTLVCSNGFVGVHVARSGDLDATLVFWMTLYSLVFIKYLIKPEKPGLHFFIIASALVGAFLSKGIAGFLFIPMLILIAIINKSLLQVLRLKELYVAVIAVIMICAGYYFLREWKAPGYWDKVFTSEFMRFHTPVMSWQQQPFGYYFENMIHGRFTPFIFFLPFTWLVMILSNDVLKKKVFLYAQIIIIGYFLLISYPTDKLAWYDAPLYPLMSLIIGMLLGTIIKRIVEIPFIHHNYFLKSLAVPLLVVLIFFFPYYHTTKKVLATDDITNSWAPGQTDELRITGAYMKRLKEKLPQLKRYTVVKMIPYDNEYYDQLKFYQRTYALSDGFSIGLKNSFKDLKSGETALVCEKAQMDSLENECSFIVLDMWKDCKLYSIRANATVKSEL